jgi:Uma2 family endonuclease
MSDAVKKIVKDDRHTYADYKTWELKEGKRYELITGTAYAMSTPNDRHQAISGEIFRQIANYLADKPCKVRAAPYDVRLFYHEDESDDTVVQPDITVIYDKNKLGSEGCRGAPDLIVGILSPHNSSEEYVRKFNIYLQAGVKEYWIVAPESKTVQIFALQDSKYLGTVCDAASVVSSGILENFSISLSEVFAV